MTRPGQRADQRGVDVLPPRNCDPEVADMMDRLDRLQTWCALMACKDSGASAAIGIVQDVRVLIVERLFTKPRSADAGNERMR